MTQRQCSLFNQICNIGFDEPCRYTDKQWNLIDVIWDVLNEYNL